MTLVSSAKVEESKTILQNYEKSGIIPNNDVEQLWKAKQIVSTALHPDTGEPIPRVFRISSFVPANMLICAGMLTPGIGLPLQLFWQWVNQSYNIGLNWANRNGTTPMTNQELGLNYVVAVTSSCGLAFSMNRLATRMKSNLVMMLVPFVSVSVAGILNVVMMRRNELTHGIDVKTQDGEVVGKSTIAGRNAILMVAGVRVVNAFPILTVVPLTLFALEKTVLKQRPNLVNPVNLLLIAVTLTTTLPCAVAMFPQDVPIRASSLEPSFHNLTKNDKPLETLYFNRGL